MKLEDYRAAMDNLETDDSKYQQLISAVESSKSGYSFRRKTVAFAAAFAMTSLLGITAAAETGLFASLRSIFYTNDPDVPLETDIENYAFTPDIAPIETAEMTINFTEAIADSNVLILCMELTCSDELLEQIPAEAFDNTYEKHFPTDKRIEFAYIYEDKYSDAYISYDGRSENTLSMHLRIYGIKEWKEFFTVNIRYFGYYSLKDEGFEEFNLVYDMDEDIIIPTENIKRCEIKKAYSEINGMPVSMELSQFGFMLIGDTDNGKEILDNNKYYFQSEHFRMFMKDGSSIDSQRDWAEVLKLMRYTKHDYTDSTYSEYIGFDKPVDIDRIEMIEVNGGKFVFE